MRFSTLFIIIILFAMMAVGQAMYESHQEQKIEFDIYNFTETTFVWNSTLFATENLNDTGNLSYDNLQSIRIINLLNKFIDWGGYSSFEVSKWVMEFGYTHHEIDYYQFLVILKYLVYLMAISIMIPAILPLVALIYVAFIGIRDLIKKFRKKPK